MLQLTVADAFPFDATTEGGAPGADGGTPEVENMTSTQ
jgi:hypothetical protein